MSDANLFQVLAYLWVKNTDDALKDEEGVQRVCARGSHMIKRDDLKYNSECCRKEGNCGIREKPNRKEKVEREKRRREGSEDRQGT